MISEKERKRKKFAKLEAIPEIQKIADFWYLSTASMFGFSSVRIYLT